MIVAGAYYPRVRASLGISPETPIRRYDRDADGQRVAGVEIAGAFDLQFHGFEAGDAGLVAALGTLIDHLEALRQAAVTRIAPKVRPTWCECGTGAPEEPNVVPAEFPDLSDWAPGAIVEAFGR